MIRWHNAKSNPPPIYKDVLLAIRGQVEAAEGCRTEDGYMFSTGHDVAGDKVYAWTELPTCPVIIPEPEAACAIAGTANSAHAFTEGSEIEGRAA